MLLSTVAVEGLDVTVVTSKEDSTVIFIGLTVLGESDAIGSEITHLYSPA